MTLFFQTWSLDVVAFAVSLFAVFFAYAKWKFTYWEKRGVQTLPVSFPMGNLGNVLNQKCHFAEMMRDNYKTFKAEGLKHGGMYMMLKPVYVPVDIEIVKSIMQKDFQHFINHGNYYNEKDDPLSAHLFALEDEKWRHLRAKLTPTFTSGRMKAMFQTLVDIGEELTSLIDGYPKDEPLDIQDVLGRFTTDIIGSCAFGLDCNTLKDPNSDFRKYGRVALRFGKLENLKGLLQFMFSKSFLNKMGLTITRPDVSNFFLNIVKQTVDYREKNNVHRKDFMHLLLQLKNRGKLADDGKIKSDGDVDEEALLTLNELSAQAFVFFIGGFETSSATMTWALYELANNPDVQQKLRDEIRDVLAKHDNKISYDSLSEMKYMDMVINETLRMYPPLAILTRNCNADYKVPGTDLLLEKGTLVMLPTLGIHKDPDYYPEPESFKPERFGEETRRETKPFTFLPFGEGPRMCIGMRFGLMQTKVGLAAILQNHRVSVNEKTKMPVVIDPAQFILTPISAILMDVTRI